MRERERMFTVTLSLKPTILHLMLMHVFMKQRKLTPLSQRMKDTFPRVTNL